MGSRAYYVYIISGPSAVLYTGVTNDIVRRVHEHKKKILKGFSAKFNLDRLLFVEEFETPIEAIEAEKRIKGWLRKKKLALIRENNPKFEDLSEGWFDKEVT